MSEEQCKDLQAWINGLAISEWRAAGDDVYELNDILPPFVSKMTWAEIHRTFFELRAS